jgi:hypothetical protein
MHLVPFSHVLVRFQGARSCRMHPGGMSHTKTIAAPSFGGALAQLAWVAYIICKTCWDATRAKRSGSRDNFMHKREKKRGGDGAHLRRR